MPKLTPLGESNAIPKSRKPEWKRKQHLPIITEIIEICVAGLAEAEKVSQSGG